MKKIIILSLLLLFKLSLSAQTKTNLPFVGTRYYNFSGGGQCCFAQIIIYKNGNCTIKSKGAEELEFGKNASIIYSGPYKSIVWEYENGKKVSGYKIEKNYITLFDKNGKPETGCDEENKPCKLELSKELITLYPRE